MCGCRWRPKAKAIGVDAELLLQRKALLQCLAGVFTAQHLWGLGLAQVQIAGIPGFVIGKFVIRAQNRMGLAIALDLGDLVQRFPFCAGGDIGLVDHIAGKALVSGKHDPVG